MGRVIEYAAALFLGIVVLAAPPADAVETWPGNELKPGCSDWSFDAATATLTVTPSEQQRAKAVLRRSNDYRMSLAPIPGSVDVGKPVLLLDRFPGRAECGVMDGISPQTDIPWYKDIAVFPLEQVAVLRVMTGSTPVEKSGLAVYDWAVLRTLVPASFRLEFIAAGAAGPPALSFQYGSEQYWIGNSPASTGAVLRAPSARSLDLDGDGDTELAWPDALPRLDLTLTHHADDVDITGFDAGGLTLETGAGNDRFIGSAVGPSKLSAGAGDDWIQAGTGGGSVNAGAGADTFIGGSAADFVLGGAGTDVLSGGGGRNKLEGGPDADQLTAGPDGDFLGGDYGADVLTGGIGNDMLVGHAGDDRLDGGDGHDRLTGGPGNDLLVAGSGNDSIGNALGRTNESYRAPGDDDRMYGGPGNDRISSDGAREVADGGPGNDYLFLRAGRPKVLAGAGNDYIRLQSVDGATVVGGPGNDTMTVTGVWQVAVGKRMLANCGAGRDWIDWPFVRTIACEAQAQRDSWDKQLGRPLRDDSKIPRTPQPPDAGPPNGISYTWEP